VVEQAAVLIDTAVTERGVVVSVAGELDVATAPMLDAALVEAVRHHDAAVIIDLAATTFVDSAAVSILIKVWKGLRVDERALVLVAPNPKVRAVLEVLGIDQLVPIEPA